MLENVAPWVNDEPYPSSAVTFGATNMGYDNIGDINYELVRFEIVPYRTMGDANRDGVVDDDDLSLLLAHWTGAGGSGGTWGTGDFDGNGSVSDDDLSLLVTNWTGPIAAAVPEPATLVLLTGAFVLVKRWGKV